MRYMLRFKFLFVLLTIHFLSLIPSVVSADTWYKGNTHTHSTISDGSPEAPIIAQRYKNHGYDFLLITDHNTFNAFDTGWNWEYLNSNPSLYPLMINGVEMTNHYHVTGIGINRPLHAAQSLLSEIETVQADGAIAALNHPSWTEDRRGLSHSSFVSTVIDAMDATGLNQVEVANMGTREFLVSDEIFWDEILSTGRKMYGIASDDSHLTSEANTPHFGGSGYGWIVVYASSLTKANILKSIKNGNYYASTGIILDDYKIDYQNRSIIITSQNGTSISFIGKNGKTLKTINSNSASYTFTGAELYVRSEITDGASMAWTQPVFFSDFPTPTPCPKPTSLAGTPLCNSTTPEISWAFGAVTGATQYELQTSRDNAFSAYLRTFSSISDTPYITSNHSANTDFYGRVRVSTSNSSVCAVVPNDWRAISIPVRTLNCSGASITSTPPLKSPTPTTTTTPTVVVRSGDANGDGLVNIADYVIWLTNYNKNLSGASNGDFNNNGKVDGIDFVIWLKNYTG